MAGRIRDEDIELVKERTDLVQLVGQHLTLRKTGADSLSGICPFHQEKTASFTVSPAKQVFYCFGCGKGGDAITFLRDLEHLSYVEAIDRLAQLAGVTLRYESDSPAERRAAQRRQAIIRANEAAAALFAQILREGADAEEARAYLAQRGIGSEAAERFGIGFAPDQPDRLLRQLGAARDLSVEVLLEAGLASRGQDDRVRDRFRGRITFPIHDLHGRAIGFGARVLPTASRAPEQPKYLNTAETPVYRKHEVLYNLHRARGPIARSGEALVVEGYTDVIALAQAGMENAVATCGTALGERHLELLSRFTQRAVLAFDSDEAGARAAERAFSFQERFPVQPVVMILPDGLDPADFVAKHGAVGVREAAARARPLVEFMIRRMVAKHDLGSIEGQGSAVDEVMPLLVKLRDPVRRGEYVHLLSDLAGVDEARVAESLERRGGTRRTTPSGQPTTRGTARQRVEREMLKLIARSSDLFASYGDRLTDEHLRTPSHRRLFGALAEAGGDVGSVAGSEVEIAPAVVALAVEPLEGDGSAEYAEGVWQRLQELTLKGRSSELRSQLQRLNPTTDPSYDELFERLIATDGELRRLRQQHEPAS